MMLLVPLLSLLLATTGFAAPSRKECFVPVTALDLPSNQTQLVRPNTAPNYVVLGVGNQNYSCTDSGTYTSAGTVAQMFDMSCLYGTSEFGQIQDDAYDVWSNYSSTDPYEPGLAVQLNREFDIGVMGQYYFINGPNGTLSPKFDFTSSGPNAGNLEAFVVATKAGDIAAPSGSKDIDWLLLQGVEGELAKEIYRVYTKAGQPPASCTPGSPEITVKYCSQYWFFGSTLYSSVGH